MLRVEPVVQKADDRIFCCQRRKKKKLFSLQSVYFSVSYGPAFLLTHG